MDSVRVSYERLEDRMRARAGSDGAVFLPNPEPQGRVEYVFVCMEPSLGTWAKSPRDARAKVASGFRNFLSSPEDYLLHFCARRYLCRPGERYHLTDLSKGAMLVADARAGQAERYERWWPLLREELELLAAPGAQVVAVGRAVFEELQRRQLGWPLTQVIHYSPLAGKARNDAVAGREEEFDRFRRTVCLEDIVASAEAALAASGVPEAFCEQALARLRTSELTPSRKKLVFGYKMAFEVVRRGLPERHR